MEPVLELRLFWNGESWPRSTDRNKFTLINDLSDIGLGISIKTGSDEISVPDIEKPNSKIDNENWIDLLFIKLSVIMFLLRFDLFVKSSISIEIMS